MATTNDNNSSSNDAQTQVENITSMIVDDTTMIKLKSMADKDGVQEEFPITLKAAKLSGFVNEAAPEDDDDDDDEDSDVVIECTRVPGNILGKIVDFLNHYAEEAMFEIPTPLSEKGDSFEKVCDQEWYQNFMSDQVVGKDYEIIFDLFIGANFMSIKPLMDLCCLKLAYRFDKTSLEENQQILKLPPLTKEEEEVARKAHPWLFKDSN